MIAAIPQHPTDEMPLTPEILFTIFLGIPVVLLLAYGLRHVVKHRQPLLLVCLLGGLIACIWEPIVDTMGLCYIKFGAATHTYTLMDREMPLFIPFVYTWYVGGLAYIAYRLYSAGITKRGMFALYLTDVFVNIFLESPGVLMGAYKYYGPQPLDFWGLPLWWTLMNPLMPMLAGAVIYKLKPHLTGWRILGVVPIIPMADGVVNAGIGWPMWITLNQDGMNRFGTHIAAAVTFSLALYVVWMLSLLVAKPEDQVRDISRGQLLKEAMEGDEPETAAAGAPVRTPETVGAMS
ncbi:hypothetical protein [Sporichthya polymorpha]|uniref:hypothetical protein n=1 Tax=Sporichthya polymorpha TaxID=35751 RepID=UPI00037F7678|nr:hypothetical protein [Sporichthya polymorpha]